jgi:hypothetical protein
MFNPNVYYSPETLLFPAVADSFRESGILDPMAFYLILDWKAPRARKRHRDRLVKIAGSFNEAVNRIASNLKDAPDPEQRLKFLLTTWGFRLPTATAILAVLYPDTCTVYDIRVCNSLGDFHRLANRERWSSKVWQDYRLFVDAVRHAAPIGLSLRDCDRWLWGQDKREAMLKELAEPG